jgi:hypothetical protein
MIRRDVDRLGDDVSTASLRDYLERESIAVAHIDEDATRFHVLGSTMHQGTRVVHPIDAVERPEGW